jgi:hypothetical protein
MFKVSAFVPAAVAAIALLAAAGPAAAHVDSSAFMTPEPASQQPTAQEMKANLARAEALNRRYHLGAYATSGVSPFRAQGEALNARYGNAWTKMPAQKFKTLVTTFGNDVTLYTPQQLRALVAHGGSSVAATSSDGFSWRDAGIGTLGAIGILLTACIGIAVYLRSRRPQRPLEGAHSAV